MEEETERGRIKRGQLRFVFFLLVNKVIETIRHRKRRYNKDEAGDGQRNIETGKRQ